MLSYYDVIYIVRLLKVFRGRDFDLYFFFIIEVLVLFLVSMFYFKYKKL